MTPLSWNWRAARVKLLEINAEEKNGEEIVICHIFIIYKN